MTTESLTIQTPAELLEKVVVHGDLARLTSKERLHFYTALCESAGLNPLSRPFGYLTLSGKLTLYALKSATDQLRKLHGVSIERLEREVVEGLYIVTAYARDKDGRVDSDIGAVPIEHLEGDVRANAILKACTKAKRRVTLSICGLGLLDETEVETIPGAVVSDDPPPGRVVEEGPGPQEQERRPPVEPEAIISKDQLAKLRAIGKMKGWTPEQGHDLLTSYRYNKLEEITERDYEAICNRLKTGPPK